MDQKFEQQCLYTFIICLLLRPVSVLLDGIFNPPHQLKRYQESMNPFLGPGSSLFCTQKCGSLMEIMGEMKGDEGDYRSKGEI